MLKTLIGNIDGMVYRCHHDSEWTMEFVSDGCLEITGYGPDDLLFNNIISYEQLTHPEDRMRVRGSINAALAQQRAPGIWFSGGDMIETNRAVRAGRAVFDEMRRRDQRSDNLVQ